jgi:hypothetical protein
LKPSLPSGEQTVPIYTIVEGHPLEDGLILYQPFGRMLVFFSLEKALDYLDMVFRANPGMEKMNILRFNVRTHRSCQV